MGLKPLLCQMSVSRACERLHLQRYSITIMQIISEHDKEDDKDGTKFDLSAEFFAQCFMVYSIQIIHVLCEQDAERQDY